MNSRGSRSKSFRYRIGILVASIPDVTKDGLYGEILEGTMDEGSDDLSRLSIEETKTRSHLRGSRGQPAAQNKTRSFGVKTRSSGGFGRSSGCVKSTKPRVERSSGPPGARAGALSEEDR